MTQIETARSGRISAEMRRIAGCENVSAEAVRRGIASGRIVIPRNRLRSIPSLCGIGEGLRTKVNANIGTSKGSSDLGRELAKMDAAVSLGADTIMDLSTGGDLGRTRRSIISRAKVPVGTVPIY